MRTVPLFNSSKVALVDDADYNLVSGYRWYLLDQETGLFYAIAAIKKSDGSETTLRMHRLILPSDVSVDHRDRDGLNNQRSNLRVATQTQNMWNTIGRRDRGASKFKGVGRSRNKWIANIQKCGQKFYLGVFESEEDAAIAYYVAAKRLFGEFARTNFTPDETAVAQFKEKKSAGRQGDRTHCIHGHEFTPENTYTHWTPRGTHRGRQCVTCKRDLYIKRRLAIGKTPYAGRSEFA